MDSGDDVIEAAGGLYHATSTLVSGTRSLRVRRTDPTVVRTTRSFGRLALALVAYSGGQSHALRYARGQAELYGESRAYLKAVMARLR